jgi:hypothetical protein
METKPIPPRASDHRRENEFVQNAEQYFDIDEASNVVFSSFAKNLLIDPKEVIVA